ncbi:MAG: UDP-N-acetylmuramoylalanine--D-glutamate ligase [Bacteroidetes bacterium]|nr:UDP-N-acetylmuramoylalanine--D-glutamate ligase [Bacteroidota bacterium]
MSENSKIKNYHSKLDLTLLSRDRVRSSEDDHHMEFVDEVNGIAFINDSKSIRLTATRNSLEAIETSVVLIIGGDDRDNDYSVLFKQVKDKVIAIVYLGTDSDKILTHYSRHNMLFTKAKDVKEAVQLANAYAQPGNVVLFSPACPSYHAFDNYKNRGNEYKELVKNMTA